MKEIKEISEITFIQGRLMQNVLIQIQMIKQGMSVPQFIKDQEIELNKELDLCKS